MQKCSLSGALHSCDKRCGHNTQICMPSLHLVVISFQRLDFYWSPTKENDLKYMSKVLRFVLVAVPQCQQIKCFTVLSQDLMLGFCLNTV